MGDKFDAAKFASDEEISKNENGTGDDADKNKGGNNDAGAGGGTEDDSDDDGEDLDWSTIGDAMSKTETDDDGNETDDDEYKGLSEQEIADKKKAKEDAEAEARRLQEDNDKVSLKVAEATKSFYSELGFETTEPHENVLSKLKALKEENERLNAVINPSKHTEQINNLKKVTELSDYDLMIKHCEIDGMSKEEAENQANILKDNGMLAIETRKIRNGINEYIGGLEAKRLEEFKSVSSMNENDLKYSKDKLLEHAKKTQTMFGFKVAKTEEATIKANTQLCDDITSGRFIRELTANEGELFENAWLIRNKKVIMKAMENRSVNVDRKNFLKHLRSPEVPGGGGSIHNPGADKEFNVKKFVQGD